MLQTKYMFKITFQVDNKQLIVKYFLNVKLISNIQLV